MSSMRTLLGCNRGSNPIGHQRASLTPTPAISQHPRLAVHMSYEALCSGPAGGCHDLITPPPEVPSTGQGQLTAMAEYLSHFSKEQRLREIECLS